MREILFRGKRIYDGEWVEGQLLKYEDGRARICESHTDIFCYEKDESIIQTVAHMVATSTVGQFTGLTDKNGKKIFEGDIVAQSWYDHDEPSDDSFGEVVFCEYDCSFSVMDVQKDGIVPLGRCHAYHWEAEIIGNIHDNPEIMEVSE
ncbi:MAG: hypothetical protein J6Q53_04200 [Oscillospiraceae bacterium]|nr:hypothetical protein [Oscillospiraceae bacterium]